MASTASPKVPPSIPPPVKPVVIGDSGLPFGSNLVALPSQNASCPCQPTVKLSATQSVTFAVEHRLAARAIAAAVELEGEDRRARREVQIRHVWHRPQRLALRNLVELVEQREDSLGLIPGITSDRFGGH